MNSEKGFFFQDEPMSKREEPEKHHFISNHMCCVLHRELYREECLSRQAWSRQKWELELVLGLGLGFGLVGWQWEHSSHLMLAWMEICHYTLIWFYNVKYVRQYNATNTRLYGVMVSIVACGRCDRGSIPYSGRRHFLHFFFLLHNMFPYILTKSAAL